MLCNLAVGLLQSARSNVFVFDSLCHTCMCQISPKCVGVESYGAEGDYRAGLAKEKQAQFLCIHWCLKVHFTSRQEKFKSRCMLRFSHSPRPHSCEAITGLCAHRPLHEPLQQSVVSMHLLSLRSKQE